MSDAEKPTQSKPTIRQKTMGGYVVVHDGFRIDIPQQKFSSITKFLHEFNISSKGSSHLFAYWLGYLMSRVKPTYKRARCRWCDKYIKKEDSYQRKPDQYTPSPFHKKCHEIVRKKEGAKRFINEAAKDKEPSDRDIFKTLGGLSGTNTAP